MPSNLGSPTVSNHNNNARLFVIGNNFAGQRNAGRLTIDDSNPNRFRPSRDHFIINWFPETIFVLYNEAIERLLEGDYVYSMGIMQNIIELYPYSVEAQNSVAFLPYLTVWSESDFDELLSFLKDIDHENLRCITTMSIATARMFNNEYYDAVNLFRAIYDTTECESEKMSAELSMSRSYFQLISIGYDRLPKNSKWKPNTLDEFLCIQNQIVESYMSRALSNVYCDNDCEPDSYQDVDEISFSSYNYPNPFNPYTTIRYTIGNVENVVINVYNVRGQRVRTLLNEQREPGHHSVIWNGTDDSGRALSSGIYFYRIVAGENTATRRMLLMK